MGYAKSFLPTSNQAWPLDNICFFANRASKQPKPESNPVYFSRSATGNQSIAAINRHHRSVIIDFAFIAPRFWRVTSDDVRCVAWSKQRVAAPRIDISRPSRPVSFPLSRAKFETMQDWFAIRKSSREEFYRYKGSWGKGECFFENVSLLEYYN